MDIDSLLKLRQEIVKSAQELALRGKGDAESRLVVLMELIRGGAADNDAYRAAFDLVNARDGDDARLDGMLDLLFELDQVIAQPEPVSSNGTNIDSQTSEQSGQ